MLSKSPQLEPGDPCGHPACCLHKPVTPKATGQQVPEVPPDRPEAGGPAFFSTGKRWLLWFLAFFGIYASSSVCPFCGTPGCPVGAGGAALVGGIFTVWWQYGKKVVGGLARFFRKRFS